MDAIIQQNVYAWAFKYSIVAYTHTLFCNPANCVPSHKLSWIDLIEVACCLLRLGSIAIFAIYISEHRVQFPCGLCSALISILQLLRSCLASLVCLLIRNARIIYSFAC